MLLVYALSIPCVIAGYLFGNRKLKIHLITLRTSLIWCTFFTTVYIVALSLFKLNLLNEDIAGTLITMFYGTFSGVIFGKFQSQFLSKKSSGYQLYAYRNSLTDSTPLLAGSTLIIGGLLRMFWDLNLVITPIQFFSGSSLIGLGLLMYTLHLVPNLRTQCILILDEIISWDRLSSYEWIDDFEVLINLDRSSEKEAITRSVSIHVNEGMRLKVERILALKLEDNQKKALNKNHSRSDESE